MHSLTAENKVYKKKLKRAEMLAFFAIYQTSLIGIEACGGAHYWARELTALGHEVILLNARYVKSFKLSVIKMIITMHKLSLTRSPVPINEWSLSKRLNNKIFS